MRDVLIKGLHTAAQELYENMDKKAHVQDVVRRLQAASEAYPHDLVIRSMEAAFSKKAGKTPDHIVSAEEFESMRQAFWGFNPRSSIKEYFGDLVFERTAHAPINEDRIYGSDAARPAQEGIADSKLVDQARDMVVEGLKNAGIGYVQTRFAKGLFSDYASNGTPSDGVLMFSANVITASGEANFSVPVMLASGQLIDPDSFAANTMKYPLTRNGVADYVIGIEGSKTENELDPEYVFGKNEVRDIPSMDTTAEALIDEAKQLVYRAFKEAGVSNCQIRLGNFEPGDHQESATMTFDVSLPFTASKVQVPVMIEGSGFISPYQFRAATGDFEISQDGLQKFVASDHIHDVVGIARRIAGTGVSRDIPGSKHNEDYRGLISTKLADDLSVFGATNPQVFYVTSTEDKNVVAAAFIGSFASQKGTCNIAIPIRIEGRDVKTPKFFYGEDESKYEFSPSGLKTYVNAKNGFELERPLAYYGEQPDTSTPHGGLDLQARIINRQDGLTADPRVMGPRDGFAQLVDTVRPLVASELETIGAINPQVQYVKRSGTDSSLVLSFAAAFSSRGGLRKASIEVGIDETGFVQPHSFVGEDNQTYAMTREGLNEYLESLQAPQTDAEKEVYSKVSILSFEKLKHFVRDSVVRGDHIRTSAAMSAISERFGIEAAQNCLNDLMEDLGRETRKVSNDCVGCPFYSAAGNRTAEDTCLKFQTRVANVNVGQHHSQCRLTRTAATEDQFDGAIVNSQIKLT